MGPMIPTAGSFDLGPQTATLVLRTTSEGKMARAGHNLTLTVEDWSGTLVVGDSPVTSSLRVTANLATLRVLDAHGGLKPLSDFERGQIEKNAAGVLGVAHQPELSFTSTAIDGTWEQGRMEGTLTLAGRAEVQQFTIAAADGMYTATGTITQSRYGIKPFSLMMGALKVGDDVTVEVTATLQ